MPEPRRDGPPPPSPSAAPADGGLGEKALSYPLTVLLQAWNEGDPEAFSQLMPLVCDELRQMARSHLGREGPGHILQPTALVNEFFLRARGREKVSFKNRAHFFGYAAQTMRLILVDDARRQQREKRGGKENPEVHGWDLDQLPDAEADPSFEVLAVHEALERLEASDERLAEVVKLRFFVGMSVEETASALETSPATVKRDWQFARLWLYRELRAVQPS